MNIPAPGSGYSDYGYGGGSIRNHFVDDPYGSYGSGDSYQSGDINAYRQQLQSYYQQLMATYRSLQAGDPRRAQCEQYIQMSLQYAQQVGMQLQGGGLNEWDPNAGISSANQSLPAHVSWQDKEHVVFDKDNSTRYVASESDSLNNKQFDIYADNNTLEIPNSASANIVQVGTNWEVTITFANGTSKKIIYHGIDAPNFKLDINSRNPTSQVHTDPSVTSGTYVAKLNNAELGSSSSAAAGTPPDKTDSTSRTWNKHDDVDYVVTKGDQTDKIYADNVNITLEDRGQTAEVTKLGAHEYEIIIKDADGHQIRKIHLYQVDSINFDGVDQENLKFKDTSKTPPDTTFKAWSDSSHSTDAQISVGGTSGSSAPGAGEALNTDHPEDTAPDSVSGNSATYNTSTDVDIHSKFDDAVNIHNITAPGNITIHGVSFADKMEIASYQAGPPPKWTVKVYKDGIQDAAHTETFNITGGANTKIILDVMDSGSLISNGKSSVNASVAHVQIGTAAPAPTPADVPWPAGQVVSNVPNGGDAVNEALRLAQELESAMASNPPNWDVIRNDLNVNFHGWDPHRSNNAIRKLVTAIFKAAGSDPIKFKALMQKIDPDVRRKMSELVSRQQDEAGETQPGDQWNSAATATQIDLTFAP